MHSKNIISGVFTLCFVFLRNVFCIWMRKTFRTLLFLCELSNQQRNNISGLAGRCKIFGVNAHKEIKVLDFLLIQIQNTCRCRIRWERSLNCIMSSIVTTLPEDYLLFINICFYAVFFCLFFFVFFLLPLYYSNGDILLVLLR